MQRIQWWNDWRELGCLPYPGGDLSTQPGFVYDVIRLCTDVHAEALRDAPTDPVPGVGNG